jgi:hypothetical protein
LLYPTIRRLSATAVNIRIPVPGNLFIDAFCNEITGRAAYALIEDAQRIFGADNTGGGWHLHPFDAPEDHEALPESMSFAEFIRRVEARLTNQ